MSARTTLEDRKRWQPAAKQDAVGPRGVRTAVLVLSALMPTLPFPANAAGSAPPAIYRCGSSYSHQPCAAGRVVQADDTVSDERRREAMRLAKTEQALIARWARERSALEREAVRGPGGLGAPGAGATGTSGPTRATPRGPGASKPGTGERAKVTRTAGASRAAAQKRNSAASAAR